jgi:hypothetical protein
MFVWMEESSKRVAERQWKQANELVVETQAESVASGLKDKKKAEDACWHCQTWEWTCHRSK